jgi:hypothetical protein
MAAMRRILNKFYQACLRKLRGLFSGVSVSLKSKIHQVENKFRKTNYVISSNSKHDVPFNTDEFRCDNLHMEERRKMSQGI